VCSAPVERSWQGRPAVYCGKRCRQAAYRARLAAERAAGYAAWLREQLVTLGAELAEPYGPDAINVFAGLPVPTPDEIPGQWAENALAYADRARRLASRAYDLTAAYRRAAADFAAARAVFGRAEASAPVSDETATRSVARSAAAAAAT
jgi:hypothetical protein